MKAAATICLLLLIAIPVFAVFQLLHRLETHKVDEGASRRFYEALRQEYGLDKPKRALTEDERIALARKISEDPFGDITADDVRTDEPEETEEKKERRVISLEKTENDGNAEAAVTEEEKAKKLAREKALATVDAMLGNRSGKGKKDALSELQATLKKYQKQ